VPQSGIAEPSPDQVADRCRRARALGGGGKRTRQRLLRRDRRRHEHYVRLPGCRARPADLEARRLRHRRETLNWILSAKDFGRPPLAETFEDATAAAVEALQISAALAPDGVADAETTAALVNSMPLQVATWYGPGFFGNETACGKVLTRRTRGVAHRKLPCGTRVVVRYGGHYVLTRVIDRGPFSNQAKWDLTQATAERLGFTYTDEVRVAKLRR